MSQYEIEYDEDLVCHVCLGKERRSTYCLHCGSTGKERCLRCHQPAQIIISDGRVTQYMCKMCHFFHSGWAEHQYTEG